MKEITSKGKVFPEVLLEWRKKYGEVFKFQIFNEICVYTSDRDTIKVKIKLPHYFLMKFFI